MLTVLLNLLWNIWSGRELFKPVFVFLKLFFKSGHFDGQETGNAFLAQTAYWIFFFFTFSVKIVNVLALKGL